MTIIGETLFRGDTATQSTYHSPWFAPQGNGFSAVCDMIESHASGEFEMWVRTWTKRSEDDDSLAVNVTCPPGASSAPGEQVINLGSNKGGKDPSRTGIWKDWLGDQSRSRLRVGQKVSWNYTKRDAKGNKIKGAKPEMRSVTVRFVSEEWCEWCWSEESLEESLCECIEEGAEAYPKAELGDFEIPGGNCYTFGRGILERCNVFLDMQELHDDVGGEQHNVFRGVTDGVARCNKHKLSKFNEWIGNGRRRTGGPRPGPGR